MTPYYEQDGITIYHGDCGDIVPELDKFDLLLTDPPYGINRSGQSLSITRNPRHARKHHPDYGWDSERPTKRYFEMMFNSCENQIVWGGNYFTYALTPSSGWIVWDKGQSLTMSDCELAWTNYNRALRRVVVNRGAIAQEGAVHPTQKPLDVIRFCIDYAQAKEKVRSILDPYMGSGTTLVVAKENGITAVGIDREEKYCEIAAKRLSQRELFGVKQ